MKFESEDINLSLNASAVLIKPNDSHNGFLQVNDQPDICVKSQTNVDISNSLIAQLALLGNQIDTKNCNICIEGDKSYTFMYISIFIFSNFAW